VGAGAEGSKGSLRILLVRLRRKHEGSLHEDDFVDHPVSPYAATKKRASSSPHVLPPVRMNVAALRFFTVYGPVNARNGDPQVHPEDPGREEIDLYGDGSSRRDYTYIQDIVSGVSARWPRPRDTGSITLGRRPRSPFRTWSR